MQAPPAMNISNFACQHCQGQIPRTMPKGTVFPCPYCHVSIESPGSDINAAQAQQYQQWAMQNGAAAASLADQQHRAHVDPQNLVFASASTQISFVRGGRSWLVGSAVHHNGTWSLRCVDASTRQQVWESMEGSNWSYPPSEQQMAVRGDRLFISMSGVLHCLDVATGQRLWSASSDAQIETHPDLAAQGDELMLYDFPQQAGGGVVVGMTQQHTICGWNRTTGQQLWAQSWDRPSLTHVPGIGVIADDRMNMTYVRAADGGVIAHWTGDELPAEVAVCGEYLALYVDVEAEPSRENRVRLMHAQTLEVLCEHAAEDVRFDPSPVMVGNRLFASVDNHKAAEFHVVDPAKPPKAPFFLFKMMGWARMGTQHESLIPKAACSTCESLTAIGDWIVFDIQQHEGSEHRNVIAVNARTGARCFDSGALSEEPTRMSNARVQTNGRLLLYVTAPGGDDNACELRAVDTQSGQEIWRKEIGEWRHHYFSEGHLIVVHSPLADSPRTLTVLSPQTGEQVTRYPFE